MPMAQFRKLAVSRDFRNVEILSNVQVMTGLIQEPRACLQWVFSLSRPLSFWIILAFWLRLFGEDRFC